MANVDASPARHQRFVDTRDPAVARQALLRMYGDVALDVGRDTGRFSWRASAADMGPVAVLGGASRGVLRIRGAPKAYIVSFARGHAVRGGSGRVDAEIAAGRGAVIFAPEQRSEWKLNGEIRPTTMRIDPSYMQAALEALTGSTVRRPPVFALPVRTESGPGSALERMCLFLGDELARGSELFDDPMITKALSETLVRLLLVGQPHDHSNLLDKPAKSSGLRAVRIVEEYVEASPTRPVTFAELSALTGESGRSLDTAFQAHRGATLPTVLEKGRIRLGSGDQGFAARLRSLSPREREVAERVAGGRLNKQIGADLGITEGTVKAHRARAMQKLGVESAAELARMFERMQADSQGAGESEGASRKR